MTDDDDAPRRGVPNKGTDGKQRNDRLAEALRTNLRKRKAQARARKRKQDQAPSNDGRDHGET